MCDKFINYPNMIKEFEEEKYREQIFTDTIFNSIYKTIKYNYVSKNYQNEGINIVELISLLCNQITKQDEELLAYSIRYGGLETARNLRSINDKIKNDININDKLKELNITIISEGDRYKSLSEIISELEENFK